VGGAGRSRFVATRNCRLPLDDFADHSTLGPYLSHLWGRSVVIHMRDMAMAAASMDLDGLASRIVLCPPRKSSRAKVDAEAQVHDAATPAPRFPDSHRRGRQPLARRARLDRVR
jgi:hypothetical protein